MYKMDSLLRNVGSNTEFYRILPQSQSVNQSRTMSSYHHAGVPGVLSTEPQNDLQNQRENMNEAMTPQEEKFISTTMKCGKCKAQKVAYSQAFTRSADEPRPYFVSARCAGTDGSLRRKSHRHKMSRKARMIAKIRRRRRLQNSSLGMLKRNVMQ